MVLGQNRDPGNKALLTWPIYDKGSRRYSEEMTTSSKGVAGENNMQKKTKTEKETGPLFTPYTKMN